MSLSSDEQALLAAIDATPLDDAPRLVYADWLQERGEDSKSEYLRTVVRLMHPPERVGDAARCVELAQALDEKWRQRVGSRFEVVLEGSTPLMLFAHALLAVWNIAQHEALNLWQMGKPVRLRSDISREEAEELISSFGTHLLSEGSDGESPLKLSVRPMGEESGPTLFAPRS